MKIDPKLTTEVFHDLIRASESRNGFTLCEADFNFLTDALKQFCHQAIEKFVDGGKRHFNEDDTDFVSSVPHLVEMRKEIVDAWMYLLAEQKLKQQRNK